MSFISRLILGRIRLPSEIEQLSVGLDRPSVCGLGAGEQRKTIEERLGPPRSWAHARKGHLDYGHLGLSLRLDEHGLQGFSVFVAAEPTDPWVPYQGVWLPSGDHGAPSLEICRKLLGEPTDVEEEEDGDVSVWWSRSCLINGDFSSSGAMLAWWVGWDGES
jgi:hypothetical protein